MTLRTAAVAFAVCALPRTAALLLLPPPENTFYWGYATALLGGTFGSAAEADNQIEPLYPAFLAAARLATGDTLALVLVLQVAVASLGGVLLHALARRLVADTRAAWIAVLMYALDPYLVRQSVALMEVSVLTVVLIAAAWSATYGGTRGALLAGLFTGTAVLTRFSLLPLALVLPFVLPQRSRRHALAAVVGAAVLVVPWSVRGQRVDGAVLPSRIGVNLAVSLSDAGEQLLPRHNNDRLVPLLADRSDAELLAQALQFAREHPWRTLKMKLRNLAHVFNPRLLPYWHEPPSARVRLEDGRYVVEGSIRRAPAAEWVHGSWRAALLLLAIVGVVRRGVRREDGILWATVLTITIVCAIFFPTTRLTTPMVFAWMIWGSAALARPPNSSG